VCELVFLPKKKKKKKKRDRAAAEEGPSDTGQTVQETTKGGDDKGQFVEHSNDVNLNRNSKMDTGNSYLVY